MTDNDDTMFERAMVAVRRRLPVVHYLVDCLVWLVALPLTTFSRYDFSIDELELDATTRSWVIAVVGQGVFGLATGLYTRRWRYGSFDEVAALASTVLLTGLLLSVVHFGWFMDGAPRSVPALTAAVAIAGTVAVRSIWRLYRQKQTRLELQDAEPLVIVGAGEGAEQIVRALLADPTSQYQPVALLDDDPNRSRLSISGVRVRGPVSQMREVAARYGARDVLLAVPSATSEVVRDVDTIANNAGLRLLTVPSVHEMFGELGVGDIRPVSEADLLGRRPADIDADAVSSYVTGRRVLVTGAGGSIGSELCRQLARFEPAALLKLDRDESGLHAVQLSIHGRALLDGDDLILADIRDRDRVIEVFDEHRPDVVFHAAALKHLPLLEAAPQEGWKTNVVGTQNLLEAAERVGVTALRERQHRQGRQPHERARVHQAPDRTPHGTQGPHRPGHLRVGAVRQRARLAGFGAAGFPGAGQAGRPDHRDAPRHHPLLHARRRGGTTRDQRRGDRSRRRGARARHGRTGQDRRRRTAIRRPAPSATRDRVHRAPAR